MVLKVDRKKPVQKAFHRVTEKIELTDFPAIPTEAFRNASKDKDIPGVKNLLGTTRTGAKLLSNRAEPEEIQEVVWAGLSKEFASNNLFYNPDLENNGKENKKVVLQFLVRLSQTPVRAFPSWNEQEHDWQSTLWPMDR